jgi:hypothetical protein
LGPNGRGVFWRKQFPESPDETRQTDIVGKSYFSEFGYVRIAPAIESYKPDCDTFKPK